VRAGHRWRRGHIGGPAPGACPTPIEPLSGSQCSRCGSEGRALSIGFDVATTPPAGHQPQRADLGRRGPHVEVLQQQRRGSAAPCAGQSRSGWRPARNGATGSRRLIQPPGPNPQGLLPSPPRTVPDRTHRCPALGMVDSDRHSSGVLQQRPSANLTTRKGCAAAPGRHQPQSEHRHARPAVAPAW